MTVDLKNKSEADVKSSTFCTKSGSHQIHHRDATYAYSEAWQHRATVWGCFSAEETGRPAAAEGHSNRAKDTEILEGKHVPNHAWTTFSFRHDGTNKDAGQQTQLSSLLSMM